MRWICAFAAVLPVLSAGVAPPAAAQQFAGTGQQATALFRLEPGLAVWELEHRGQGRFVVRLLGEQGVLVDTLADAAGGFRGSRAVQVPQGGRYLLDVAADGAWSVRLRGDAGGAQAAASHMGEERLRSHGRYYGQQAANAVGGSGRYLFGGLLGGIAAGPIGAGVVYGLAVGRTPPIPGEIEQSVAHREPVYRDEFLTAFQSRLRGNRRTAALVGGVTGTAVFFFAVAQMVNWGGGTGGGGGPPGGELP
jgi:hypothetical protein